MGPMGGPVIRQIWPTLSEKILSLILKVSHTEQLKEKN